MRRLLIVEEALRDRRGHWAEYIGQVVRMHRETGDDVTVLGHQEVTPELQAELGVQPFFRANAWSVPETIVRAPRWRRLLWRARHIWRSASALRKHLRQAPPYSCIFVTSVGLLQLYTWVLVATRIAPERCPRLVLLFLAGPGRYLEGSNAPVFGPDARAWRWALQRLASLIQQSRVVLEVENEALGKEFEALANVPSQVLPIPLPPALRHHRVNITGPRTLRIASLGFARHERGSDLLLQAIPRIRELLAQTPGAPHVQFVLQWMDAFRDSQGNPFTLADARQALQATDVLIERGLAPKEYAQELLRTDIMLLPYRRAAYRIRTSRLAAECACAGIPMICTEGTWLARAMEQWGAGLEVPENDTEALARATVSLIVDYEKWQERSRHQSQEAHAAFSDEAFLRALWLK